MFSSHENFTQKIEIYVLHFKLARRTQKCANGHYTYIVTTVRNRPLDIVIIEQKLFYNYDI